jgi:hypothetical protein
MKKLNETVVMKTSRPQFDVTSNKKSIAGKVEPLISKMGNMTPEEIKAEFLAILNDPTTNASEQVRNKWKNVVNALSGAPAYVKNRLMQTISNLYLAGARLGVSDSEQRPSSKHIKMFEDFGNDHSNDLRVPGAISTGTQDMYDESELDESRGGALSNMFSELKLTVNSLPHGNAKISSDDVDKLNHYIDELQIKFKEKLQGKLLGW